MVRQISQPNNKHLEMTIVCVKLIEGTGLETFPSKPGLLAQLLGLLIPLFE